MFKETKNIALFGGSTHGESSMKWSPAVFESCSVLSYSNDEGTEMDYDGFIHETLET